MRQASDVIETLLSRVFLTPDRVYKQLKPVTTSFVDLAGRADRLAAATREYELNRRLAPDVYLGMADVEEGGELVDRFVVMRRLPAERQLDHLLDHPGAGDRIREVARHLAAVHAAREPQRGQAAIGASRSVLAANWDDAFDTIEPLVGPVIGTARHDRARGLVDRYLAGRGPLFDERIDQGWVRDGHGDLRAEHVFCLDDGPRLIDCLAFRDDLRITDVLLDLAFLVMDLHRLAGVVPAMSLIQWYDEFTGEHHPASLAHHYVAYRAMVRAKVSALQAAERGQEAVHQAATYHDLALQHLLVGQTRLVLVGGGAGVGKSTVAAGLAEAMGAVWLRADEIRKNLAGLPADAHAFAPPDQGIYTPSFSDDVYREMLREAGLLLERGESVVLDATWSSEIRRGWARSLAETVAAEMTEIECHAPLSVARERIARRLASLDEPSDATPDIADHLAAQFEPWVGSQAVDTARSIADSIEEACHSVLGRPGPDRGLDRSSGEASVAELVLSAETVEFFLSRISAWERRMATTPWPAPSAWPA